jgi:hypothetical protein
MFVPTADRAAAEKVRVPVAAEIAAMDQGLVAQLQAPACILTAAVCPAALLPCSVFLQSALLQRDVCMAAKDPGTCM